MTVRETATTGAMTGAQWTQQELPRLLRSEDTAGLCQVALLAVEGGFAPDALPLADKLRAAAVDDEQACLACVALWTAVRDVARAGDVLSAFEERHGERPSTMLARARLLVELGKADDGLALARSALLRDPDLHPGLMWAVALADRLATAGPFGPVGGPGSTVGGTTGSTRKASAGTGAVGARALLTELSALPKAWRARGLLALWHIQRGDDGDEATARALLARIVDDTRGSAAEAEARAAVAAAGPGLQALAEAHARAARDWIREDRGAAVDDVTAIPLTGPVWAAVLKDAATLVPPTSASLPSVAVFVLADEVAGAPALRDGAVGAQTPTGRLCRGLALALAEQLSARLGLPATVVSPVVGDVGFWVATRPWELVSLLPFVPRDPAPRLVISGTLQESVDGKDGLRVILEVHDLQQGGAPLRVDGGKEGLAGVIQPLLRAVGTRLGIEKQPQKPGTTSTTPRAHDVDDRYVGALADVHALLLVATGRLRPDQLWHEDAAFDEAGTLLRNCPPSIALPATLLLLAAAVCTTAVGRPVPASTTEQLRDEVQRHRASLGPLLPSAERLLLRLAPIG